MIAKVALSHLNRPSKAALRFVIPCGKLLSFKPQHSGGKLHHATE